MKQWVAVALWWVAGPTTMGHHDPGEVIAGLSQQLVAHPDDVGLLSRRATEYRALGMHAKAEADLRRVLALEPGSAGDTESLARVLWAQGKSDEALAMAARAVNLATPGRERAAALILLAGWQMERERFDAAKTSCAEAFREDPMGMVDWYLLQARLQELVETPKARAAGLKDGWQALGSVVLRDAWVDASLDAGMHEEAAPLIETELREARLKSSWLIRRGRMRLQAGDDEQGWSDLKAAIAELNQRIHPLRPDGQLLIDRGRARCWLGESDAAAGDLAMARRHGGEPWEIDRLARLIGR